MALFNGMRQTRRGGANSGRGDDPHGATQGYTFHGFYPQGMEWGSAQSGSSLSEVSNNYANGNSRQVGDWSVGAIKQGKQFFPTAMTARHANDLNAVNKDMQVGNIGFKSARKARKASVQAIKQSGGLPNAKNPNAPQAANGTFFTPPERDPFA